MKRYRSKGFRLNQDIDSAYRRLFGPENPAGCAVCGENEPSVLDIHEAGDSNDFKVLCSRCHGATRQYFDNGLQKQIGGSHV